MTHKKIFSYQLSRARRTIENVFRILVVRWKIFKRPIHASIKTIQSIIGTCVGLQKYLQTTQTSSYSPPSSMEVQGFDGTVKEGDWQDTIRCNCILTNFTKVKEEE